MGRGTGGKIPALRCHHESPGFPGGPGGILAAEHRCHCLLAHAQAAGPPGHCADGELGSPRHRRGALSAQPQLAGLAGRERSSTAVSAPAHRHASAEFTRGTLQSGHAAATGPAPISKGVSPTVHGQRASASAAPARGTAPFAQPGDDPQHSGQRRNLVAAPPCGDRYL